MEDIFAVECYRGFYIDTDMLDGNGYTVFVDGDEWFFETREDARSAIDEYLDHEVK